jgi:hypothetical protein
MVGHATKTLDQVLILQKKVHSEFGDLGQITAFLTDVLNQCESKMDLAASRDDPIFGSISRDL